MILLFLVHTKPSPRRKAAFRRWSAADVLLFYLIRAIEWSDAGNDAKESGTVPIFFIIAQSDKKSKFSPRQDLRPFAAM